MKLSKGALYIGLLFLTFGTTAVQATLSLDTHALGGFYSPEQSNSTITFLAPTQDTLFLDEVIISRNEITNAQIIPLGGSKFTGSLLNYPNPFSMRTGTRIGYQLTGPMDIELRIFTQTGYQVYKTIFLSTEEGGLGKYNHITINTATLGGI